MTKKISQLPAATSVDTNDEFVINQDGTTKKLTTANQWDFANVNIDGGTIDGTAVNATTLEASGDVNFDSGTLFVDASANNVGIGTTSPSLDHRLEINNSFGVSGGLLINASSNHINIVDNETAGPLRHIFGTASDTDLFISADADNNTANTNIRFFNDNTERMRIDSNGHAIIPAGVTLGTSAGVYNAANTLDDYETGTWTPVYDTTNGDLANFQMFLPGVITLGFYTKIGRMVYIQAEMATQNAASISGTGIPIVKNLPFPIRTTASANLGNNFFVSAGTGGRWNNNPINGVQVKDTTTIRLAKTNPSGFMSASDFLAINNANFNTLSLSFCYMTD